MRSGLLTRVVALACRTQHSRLVLVAAMSGSLVTPSFAQDVTPNLGQVQEFRKSDTNRVQFYSKKGQELESAPAFEPQGKTATSSPTPQPYQRTAGAAPLKNYHAELFGETKPSSTGVQPIPTAVENTSGPILNAAYQYDPNSDSSEIRPAGAEQPAQTAELPEWAQNMKSRTPDEAKKPVVAEISIPGGQRSSGPVLQVAPASTVEAPKVQLADLKNGPQTPSMKIEWKSLSDINVGQECECELLVSNVGGSSAFGVNVEATFPTTVRLLEASPRPQTVASSLTWDLGKLDAGQATVIKVKMIPSERGELNATAQVHFTGAAQSAFVVREPQISLDMQGPTKVMIGDPASHNVTITNPGNGIAKNVRLEAIIPAGLEHSRGERLLMDVGSLNPGESRTIRLALAAVGGGNQVVQVAATAEGGLARSTQSSVTVIAPSLQAEISGPGLRYIGRNAAYTLRVMNDGTVATSNVRVMHKVPDGFEFVSASKGASFDAPTRILSWFVGKLEAGKSAEMQVELKAEKIGDFVHYIRATSEHGSTVDSQILTRVDGTSSLVVEITDLDDPVEVGHETAYEIKILNEGSAAAKEVGLSCELPEGVRFLKAEGPSQHVVDGNTILFQPLANVGTGNTIKYRVHVTGNIEGNLRFRARLTSAASPEPLIFEELTRFYGDGN
ncbi:MAG: DUF11 domain-containing protein [Planctomycetaceae bacterium]|nr:DUF11 domain-containing protein [Planctomycetaceae bacterium]